MATNPFDQFDAPAANTFDQFDKPVEKPRTRGILETANDTVIEVANAAAGGVSSLANMVRPGNQVSSFIDKNIIKAGEEKQSDVVKSAKQTLSQGIQNADGIGGELSAVGKYVVDNPLLAASQAVGSFAVPGAAAKVLGRVGGIGAGAAMAGGDAAGTAYDLSSKAGATDAQALAAGRQASVIPALVGGVTGAFGAEKLLAGGSGFKGGIINRAVKTGLSEAGQEGFEEGITQYEGQRAAMPYDATIDPSKGVAAAAGMGAIMGGATGAGVSLLTGNRDAAKATPEAAPASPVLPAPTPDFQPVQPTPVPVIQPTPTPQLPSEAMGINPSAGVLSKAAAMAVDTGAHDQTLQAAAEQAMQAAPNKPEAAQNTPKSPEIAPETPSNLIAEQAINAPATAENTPENTPIYGSAYAQRQATAPKVEPTDILDAAGQPFVTGFSAKRAAEAAGDGFRPFKIAEKQFVVRNFATENIAIQANDTPATPTIEAKNAPKAEAQTTEAGTNEGTAGAQPAATDAPARTSAMETARANPQSTRDTLTREIETGLADVTGVKLSGIAIQQRKRKLEKLKENDVTQAAQTVQATQKGQAPAVPKSVNAVPFENRVSPTDVPRTSPAVDSGSAVPAGVVLPERSGSDLQARPEAVSQDAEKVSKADITEAAHAAATSPKNDLPEPTQAQKEAGNYKKGHVSLHGMDIAVENPVGSTRSGTDAKGKKWSNTMRHHYGYIKGTVGMDKDHVDTFIGDKPESTKVFVVDQIDPRTGKADEHKVMLGFETLEAAQQAYQSNYAKDWTGGKTVTETSVDGFKAWLKEGDTKKPFATQNIATEANNTADSVEVEPKKSGLDGYLKTLNKLQAGRVSSVLKKQFNTKDGVKTRAEILEGFAKDGVAAKEREYQVPITPKIRAELQAKRNAAYKNRTNAKTADDKAKYEAEHRQIGEQLASGMVPSRVKELVFPDGAVLSGKVLAEEIKYVEHLADQTKQVPADLAKMQAGKAKKEAEPTKTPPDIRAEQMRQQKIKIERASRLKAITYNKSPFLAFLGKHGIALSEKSEFSPDKNPMLSGYGPMFRRNGLPIDLLVSRAVEDGFLPPGTDDDTNLRELISRQMSGESIAALYTEDGATEAMQAEIGRRAGFDEEQLERDAEAQLQQQFDEEALELIANSAFIDENYPDPVDALLELGFTYNDIEDTYNEYNAQNSGQSEDAQTGGSVGSAAASEAKSPSPTTPSPAQEEGLAAPTREGILAQQERAAQAEKDQAAADKAADKATKQAAGKKEIDARQEASAENFQLGQSAEDSLSGQASMFDSPAEQKSPLASESTAKPAIKEIAKKLIIGVSPKVGDAISVKDGVIHIGKYPAQNFETGEDVIVAKNASTTDIKKALTEAGAISGKMKFYEVAQDAPLFSRQTDAATERTTQAKSKDQSDAILLNRTMANHLKDDSWSNAYEQVDLPDTLSEYAAAASAAFDAPIVAIRPTDARFDQFNGINVARRNYVNVEKDISFINIAGHEIYHDIERNRPDLHAWLVKQATQHFKGLDAYRDKLNAVVGENETAYTNEAAQIELLADFTGDALADPVFVAKLAEDNPSKFRALLKHVSDWLRNVASKLSKKDLGSSKYFNDVEAMRKHLNKVLMAYTMKKNIAEFDAPSFSRDINGSVTNQKDVAGNQGGRSASDNQPSVSIDESTGIPLNADGTVTVYHHTSKVNADAIRKSGKLKAQAEPDVYVTTQKETDTGYGDTAVAINVAPSKLTLDDEFPNGRKDFRLTVGKPGGEIKVTLANESTAPNRDGAEQSALEELSQADDLFALPKSEKKDIQGILAENDPLASVKTTRTPLGVTHKLTMPDGTIATLTERKPNIYGKSLYSYDLVNGEMVNKVTERPGENPDDVPPTTDLWLDVSKLKTGQNGALAYNVAATYAHNNGMIFIGDPAGLSDAALRRRTEQMISSALKFGTTDHLAPHPRQVKGDTGVPPLKWVYGDSAGNIERMIDVSMKSLENAFPTSKLIAYKDGNFYRTDTNQSFRNGRQLAGVVGQSFKNRLGVYGGTGETGYGGWRSVARNALFGFLKSSPATGGRPDGRELLDGLRNELPRLRAGQAESGAGEAKDRIFYSRSLKDRISDKLNKTETLITGQTNRQYSAEQLAAMKSVGFQVETKSLAERAKTLWHDAGKKMAQGIADQFAPVKALDGAAYGLLRLSKGASGAFETFLKGGQLKISDGVYDFDDASKGGVIDQLLTPLQGEHHDFMRWVAANRAERLRGEGKENLFTEADIKALKTLQDGQTGFDYTLKNGIRKGQVTRNRAEIYRDSLGTFNGFNKNILDMAEQSGLIDGDSRKLWEQEFYVPFYRVADEDSGGVRGMNIKGGVMRQQAFKELKGGKNALNADLLDNTLMNWAHLLDASAKNRAAKATIEAAEKMGIASTGDQHVLAQMGASINNKNGVVWFMDGGQKRYSLIDKEGDGPYLMTALTALEYAGMRNPVMNAMGAFKHALTVGVTASPFFKIRNLIRDSVQVIGTSGIDVNPAKNIAQGWKLTDPKSDAYFRLLAGGGTIHFGTMMEGSEAKRVQSLVESGVDDATILNSDKKVQAFYRKFIAPGIDAYNELGNRGEAVNRAALYDQLRKGGMNHADASLQARDLMDFSMQGSFTTIRFLTQVVPFFNARIQGMYKLGRSAKENPARFSAVIGAAAVISITLLAAYGDDDDWKKREEWDRNNFWWFKFGGIAFRIPKPFEIGAVATLAERGFELAFDDEMTGKRFGSQVMTLLGDNLSMNPVPQMVKPIMDVYANKNSFNGQPIETMSMERLQPEYRFNGRTSMLARGMSTAANSVTGLVGADAPSPVQIDHMLRGYFGWLGSFAIGTGDLLARPATGQTEQATPDYWKWATGGIASDLRDAPSRYVSQMYTQAKELEQVYGTWKALIKEGKQQEANEFFESNREKLSKYKRVERVKMMESRLNQQIKMIERSDADSDDKRERIRQVQIQKNKLAESLVV